MKMPAPVDGRLHARRTPLPRANAIALVLLLGLTLLVLPAPSGANGMAAPARSLAGLVPSAEHRATNGSPSFPTPIRHVFLVMLENYPRSTVMADGPFQASLTERYASADHFYAICHPGGGDYLALTSGSPNGLCGKGGDTWWQYNETNLGDSIEAAGLTWMAYLESMPTPCDKTNTSLYTSEHNPFIAYADIANNTTRCDTHDVGFAPWEAAVNATNGSAIPNYGYFAPNYLDDAHNTNVSYADRWMRGWLSPYLNASWFSSSVFFFTYDESAFADHTGYNGTDGGNVYFAAVSPFARLGYVDPQNLTFYNVITTTEWLLGLPSLGHGDNWSLYPPMRALFAFPPPLTLTATASAMHTEAPATVHFAAEPSGGTPPYNVTWRSANGTLLGFGPTLNRTIPSAENLTVIVDARDARNVTNSTSLTVQAYAPLATQLTLAPANLTVGSTVTATANVTGGTDTGLVYGWSWNGSPLAGTNRSVSVIAASPGTFTVAVTVTDAWGDRANASAFVHVSPQGGTKPPHGNTTPPLPPLPGVPPSLSHGYPGWALAGIGVAVVAAALLALWVVRRRRTGAPSRTPSAPAEPAPAPPAETLEPGPP
jgi:hypothetical protein